jgi:GNAT superfamily N-acetyltransferase
VGHVVSESLPVQVFPSRDVDLAAMTALVNAAFAVYPFLPFERTSIEGLAEEIGDDGDVLWLESGGQPLACALIRPSLSVDWGEHAPFGVNAADALYLGLVCVDPGSMRHGLGRHIVTEAERIARERGFDRIVLGTVREMGNVGYYERVGYRVIGSDVLPAGHWGMTIDHDYCAMEKHL